VKGTRVLLCSGNVGASSGRFAGALGAFAPTVWVVGVGAEDCKIADCASLITKDADSLACFWPEMCGCVFERCNE
jgi:hypothetical protein